MSTTVYHGEPNGPSLTVLAALFETGVEATLIHIDLAKGRRHALDCAQQPEVSMSVEGEGPVVVVDGEGMTDSVFIACYLDDVGTSGRRLRPADPYARWEMMCWCRQLIERTAPAAAYLGLNAHPLSPDPEMLAKIGSADLLARWKEAAIGMYADGRLEDSRTKIVQAVDKLEARLEHRAWLMGDFSLADLESYAWLAGMVERLPSAFSNRPRVADWLQRMRARPSVAKALALARTPAPAASWVPGPEINRWG